MTQFKRLDDAFFASSQIDEAAIAQAAADGVTLVISNRPDGEEAGQPTAEDVAGWAEKHGLAFRHIPFVAGQLSMDQVQDMRQALDSAAGPVLGFCKSGGRSAALWAAVQALDGGQSPDALIAAAGNAGYDIKPLRPALEQLAAHQG